VCNGRLGANTGCIGERNSVIEKAPVVYRTQKKEQQRGTYDRELYYSLAALIVPQA
jgi:hypothetical protein